MPMFDQPKALSQPASTRRSALPYSRSIAGNSVKPQSSRSVKWPSRGSSVIVRVVTAPKRSSGTHWAIGERPYRISRRFDAP